MDPTLLILVFLVVVALAFDFLNGLHDAANSIATIVSTRVLSAKWAVLWAAFFNFIAFLFFGTSVAKMVGSGIVDPHIISDRLIFAALMGAISWNLLTWWAGIPSSSSHALIGGLGAIQWAGLAKTAAGIVVSPTMGFILALLLVLIPHVGREVNGARRWIPIGPINIQPSEFMKLAMALYAADYTARKLPVMKSFMKAFVPMAAMVAVVGFLLLREPDFGALIVIACIAFGILFLGGMNVRIFAALSVFAVIMIAILVLTSPYRRERLFGFSDPWKDALGSGYQLSHALIAFGRGEWFGVGLGGSIEKLFYLPEAHTDFLLAVIAEELGFTGVLVVIVLFAIIVQRAFAIARRSHHLERHFSGLVAQGIGLWIGAQSLINMGVNMGVLPTKGLTLPLMSFGGSGILANCLALAVLLRIDWENRQLPRSTAGSGYGAAAVPRPAAVRRGGDPG